MHVSPISQVNSNTYNKNTSFTSAPSRIYRSAGGVAREAENTYLQKFFENIRSIARVFKRESTQNAEVFIPMPRGRKPSAEEIDMADRANEVCKRVPMALVYNEEMNRIAREYGFNNIREVANVMRKPFSFYGYERVFDNRFKRYPRSVSELTSIYNEFVSSSMRYYRDDSVDVNSLCWQEFDDNRAMSKCIPWFTKNYPNTVIVKRNGKDVVKSGHNRIDFYSGNNDGRVLSIEYNPRNRRFTYKKQDANNQEIFKFTPYDATGKYGCKLYSRGFGVMRNKDGTWYLNEFGEFADDNGILDKHIINGNVDYVHSFEGWTRRF